MEINPTQPSPNVFNFASHISDVYTCTPEALETIHMPRYKEVSSNFQKIYGIKPQFFARAPGRVNLIGEHIDYCGYGVLPMALEQDTLIAFSPSKDQEIIVNHMLPSLFPPIKLSTDPFQKQRDDKSYINYFIAGYKAGLVDTGTTEFTGIKLLISGNLPQQAGLSSSSSFIVATGMMSMAANGLIGQVDRTDFIEKCIKCERETGTAGGGMDQTISVLGKKGNALYIEFNPIKSTDVQLPPGYCFVVANSLTPSPKLLTLGTRYNKRAVECRLALNILKKKLDLSTKPELGNFKKLQDHFGYSFKEMLGLVDQHIKKEPFSIKDLEEVFEGPVINQLSDMPNAGLVLESNSEFFLYLRAQHVFGEAGRVIEFRDICNNDSKEMSLEERAKRLGDLMNESHKSCKELYDCSSEQLDKLINLARTQGALGSRLTGAGWGGCCVSLVKESESEKFIQEIMNQYYMNEEEKLEIKDDLNMYIFSSYPASGAAVLNPEHEVWL